MYVHSYVFVCACLYPCVNTRACAKQWQLNPSCFMAVNVLSSSGLPNSLHVINLIGTDKPFIPIPLPKFSIITFLGTLPIYTVRFWVLLFQPSRLTQNFSAKCPYPPTRQLHATSQNIVILSTDKIKKVLPLLRNFSQCQIKHIYSWILFGQNLPCSAAPARVTKL